MNCLNEAPNDVHPNWVPEHAKTYLKHVSMGVSIRALARSQGCHASTILRQVRKFESRRDDPLIDEALNCLSQNIHPETEPENTHMATAAPLSEVDIARHARRILRRLCETGAYLLIAPQMEVAAVFKETVPGRPTRIAVVDRSFARTFALKEWIAGEQLGKLGRYKITSMGRSALKRMIAEDRQSRGEDAGNTPFQEQHKEFGERVVKIHDGSGRKNVRFNFAESPLTLLARKKDKSGAMYLSPELLEAGERLREDFEQAQLGPRVAQNWDRFLTSGGGGWNGGTEFSGSTNARDRVSGALKALGPGLADVALRVCCFLEGMEKAEKRLGWSARSGKVVLKIALQRLADHYGIAEVEQRRAS
ncbi:hypothetical protein A9Q96_04090 [Rhodobacterales bacterium 52_120_T64]|nr:hypothetical protein A9Q96_04090 [Rhodobacterales bacterium 52_120_T64]